MTTYQEVYDIFLTGITDYKIDKLYDAGTTLFENYLQGFLIKAIPNFTNCVQDLDSVSSSTPTSFMVTLTRLEKGILSDLMTYEWFMKEVNDVTQFNLTLSDTDFKHFSEAQNLKEKQEKADRMREMAEQKMTVYGLKNVPWADWGAGIYG
jgi:hypothetical protein